MNHLRGTLVERGGCQGYRTRYQSEEGGRTGKGPALSAHTYPVCRAEKQADQELHEKCSEKGGLYFARLIQVVCMLTEGGLSFFT